MKLLIAVAVLSTAAGYGYWRFWEPQQSSPNEITLYGNIDIREADLAFNVGGRIERMLVEEGDAIRPGELLALLDDRIYRAEVQAAQARFAAQQAIVDRYHAGSRPQEIKKLRGDIAAIEATLKNAEATLRRTQSLASDDFATRQKLDDDTAQVNTLTGQLNAKKQELSLAVEGPRQEDIAQAEAQLSVEKAALELAMQNLRYTKLTAQKAGTVKTRILEPGSVVSALSPVYSIALSDPLWARTYVSEPDLGRIRPGMAAQVFTDTNPDQPYEGWIGFISPSAEFTPKSVETPQVRTSLVYRLRVFVKNPANNLRQGMPVTIRLRTGADIQAVPAAPAN